MLTSRPGRGSGGKVEGKGAQFWSDAVVKQWAAVRQGATKGSFLESQTKHRHNLIHGNGLFRGNGDYAIPKCLTIVNGLLVNFLVVEVTCLESKQNTGTHTSAILATRKQ